MTPDAPERLDLRSHDIAADKRDDLLRLFPEVRTEDGSIDFERLRLVLGGQVDSGRERYGLTWPGKAECFRAIQTPSLGTLRPAPEESVNFNTTENLIIEGDNLEVLKLLQKSYLGKVKMIYIDPPYNTGNDFIYPDNYSESLQTYLEYTGQIDAEGRKFANNPETHGRFHSKWLNMMYPRLYLARNLLRDDGVIFVSIDEHEVHALRDLLNEVFGEEHFAGQIAVVNNLKGRNDRAHFATAHEHLLVYSKGAFETFGLPLNNKQLAEYDQADDQGLKFQWRDLRKRGGADTSEARPNLYFPIYADPTSGRCSMEFGSPFTLEIFPTKSDGTLGCWRWGKTKVVAAIPSLKASRVEGKNRWNVAYPVYLEANGQERVSKPKTVWTGPELSTDAATKGLKEILGVEVKMTPKPVELLRVILHQSMDEDDLCLDFFAGSGTTAHCVLDLNRQDGGNRRFILVQLPEPTGRDDYKTIADISKERVRRVIARLNAEDAGTLDLEKASEQDRGFRVFKLAESNFTPWDPNVSRDGDALMKQLELHVQHVRDNRTDQDLLYEILLKSGFALTTPVELVVMAGKHVHCATSAEGSTILICLDRDLTLEVIREMAARKPERVVCLDEGFAGHDQLKANAVQAFRSKGIVGFKTV